MQLRSISKRFGGFTAIENIDLDIRSGELVALLGPSGCGKTTTLRMIAGLENPTTGEIHFDDRDVSDLRVQDRNVGMVFQRYALFPHMTVEKNIAFGLSVRGTPRSEISDRLDEIIDVVQLGPFRQRFPAQLSGGQMQRVAIARTLITKPSVLMMDEPLANLDTKLRGEMRRFIRTLQQRLGITTIFVTHDQVEAMELADRIAVIFNGHLAQFGPPEDLYRQPVSVDVADFMGASNIFPGTMTGTDAVKTGFGTLSVVAQPGMADGSRVHAMLRNEGIDIHPANVEGGDDMVAGRIAARDFFGATVNYVVECGAERIIVNEQSRRLLDVGMEVRLDIPAERVWLMAG
ncbi:MAG: ABC transporter ATP-binding protein [Paracoccus sp. (in: a-proteobacteria)]|uniref:ABC transporter ATP-binding protein n=1 Tax=unclassified Paracoccus (in: a-proteobacteria) TaxID=2688777 RepID=UPI0025FC58F7|nr:MULTISPECIES: ABC transporter ATP-binding protein [unclassified Paracoccus (in: a-proteobacteria)]